MYDNPLSFWEIWKYHRDDSEFSCFILEKLFQRRPDQGEFVIEFIVNTSIPGGLVNRNGKIGRAASLVKIPIAFGTDEAEQGHPDNGHIDGGVKRHG